MYMRSSHAADSTEKGTTGNLRSHINSKLVKASRYSSQLVDLLQDKESKARVKDIVEAKAYHASMCGAAAFERHGWEGCLQAYCLARMIYSALVNTKSLSKVEPVSELLSGTIDPNIRYAAHQLRTPRTTSVDTVVERFAKGKDDPEIQQLLEEAAPPTDSPAFPDSKSIEIPKSITWRSRTVPLEDASLAQAIAVIRAAEAELSDFLSGDVPSLGKRATAYDSILVAAQDAVDATKAAIDELMAEGVPQYDRRMQALQITRTAVNYDLVGWRIGRNRVLCGPRDGAILEPHVFNRSKSRFKKQTPQVEKKSDEPTKPVKPEQETTPRLLRRLRERTVLYDGILQSFDSIKDLPGVAADSSFISELGAKRSYFAALRCLAIARGHDLLGQSKNALALFARAEKMALLVESKSSLANQESNRSAPTALTLNVTAEQISALLSLLSSLTLRHRALVEMHNLYQNDSATTAWAQRPLIERLNVWPNAGKVDLRNLVQYPPVMECVPVKPIFLDLAWNYVQYPGVKGKSPGGKSEAEVAKEEKRSRGWFGFGR